MKEVSIIIGLVIIWLAGFTILAIKFKALKIKKHERSKSDWKRFSIKGTRATHCVDDAAIWNPN